MLKPGDVVTVEFPCTGIGQLTDGDWEAVQRCLQASLAVTP